MDDEHAEEPRRSFVEMTWRSVEARGVPASPVRDALFTVARCLDSDPSGDILALASGAYRALQDVLEDHYKKRSPLQIQVETLRNEKALSSMLKSEFPRVNFSAQDFDPEPESPDDLARLLGYQDGGRVVRAALRRGFPDHPKHARWAPLSDLQINYVRAHVPDRRSTVSAPRV